MPEIPRTKFNSPWTVANIETALNDVSSAKGSSESLTAALNAMRAEINSLSGGVHLKGAVDYYSDLPASPSEGDAYTVRYQGTSGTDPLGIEYAWATYQGTPQWIPIGVDPSVFAKQTEMDVVANAGAKNLLPMTHAGGSITRYGVTCTWDLNAGTMTLNGTHISGDNASIFEFYDGSAEATKMLPAGSYVLTGCPAGGSTSTYRAALSQIAGAVDIGNGATFELSEPHYAAYRILISGNVTFDNMIFKPMIRPASITDPTFQPYAKTNRELTVLTDEDRASLVEIVDGGAKNKLLYDGIGTPTAPSTLTFTYNTDGSITVNGSTGANESAYVFLQYNAGNVDVKDFANGCIISGVPSGASGLSLRCNSGNTIYGIDTGNGGLIQYSGTAALRVLIFVDQNTTLSNVKIKPMICTKGAWGISHEYQPYRPSWQQMWDAIQALQSGGNRALTMQMQPTEPEEQEER